MDVLGKMVACELKKVPVQNQLQCKMEIQQVLNKWCYQSAQTSAQPQMQPAFGQPPFSHQPPADFGDMASYRTLRPDEC